MSRLKIIGLIVLGLILLTLPLFVSSYMTQIAVTTITYAMLGLVFSLGIRVGLPRLDMAAWWGIGGYTTALLMKMGLSFWLTVIIGGFISVVLGAILFSLALPRGMIAFFTFGMVLSMAIYQLFGSVPLFGGWGGTTGVPFPTLFSFVFDSQTKIYYLGLFFLGLAVCVYYLCYHSRIGRAWDSINSSIKLARSVGVDVVKYRLANVLIGNFFLAVAGSYFVGYYRAAIPSIFSFNAGVSTVVYLFIGGFGHSLIGPVIGAIIATFIPEYLRFAQTMQTVLASVVVILILLFLPSGFLGIIDEKLLPWLKIHKWFVRLNNWSLGRTGNSEMEGTLRK